MAVLEEPSDKDLSLDGHTAMSVIGTFTPTRDGGWAGTIRTLTIAVKARFVPDDNRESDRGPDFRVFAGRSELGATWRERAGGETPRVYLRVRLDDPAMAEPLSAALFERRTPMRGSLSGRGGGRHPGFVMFMGADVRPCEGPQAQQRMAGGTTRLPWTKKARLRCLPDRREGTASDRTTPSSGA